MRNRWFFFLILVPCSIFNVQWSMIYAQQFVEDSVKVDGYMRRFDVFLPEGIKADAPLVFYLHGYGGRIYHDNPMVETAKREGFAVWLYEVVGGKHSTHTEDIKTGDEIWSFFKKHLKENEK